MLFILAILYFFQFHNTISASPISHLIRDATPPDLNSPPSLCVSYNQQRSLWDILWSCLATIFACTWVSVHPNIPPSGEKWWKTTLRRVELMFWALVAPEVIIYWAMRQWYGARTIVKKYQGHGWTKTHAYFIQMGGFTLFEAGKPKQVLLPRKMEDLLVKGKIDLPQITEEEIRDRSKGDGLSKALVISQTSWFVAQCIARIAQGLILTELELVTGAFAILNGVMYFLWWNKPLDVRCSVPVHLLDEAKPEEQSFKFKSTEKLAITRWPWDGIFFLISLTCRKSLNVLAPSVTWISTIKDVNLNMLQKAAMAIITFPWIAIRTFYLRLVDIADMNHVFANALAQMTGTISTVSTFYASADYTDDTIDDLLVPSVTSIIAALFGGLHCVAWLFSFPSHAEMIIWRISAAVIAAIPLTMVLFFIAGFCSLKAKPNSVSKIFFEILWKIDGILILFCLPIYAIARLFLLGEAFAALRYLSPGALAVVNWLSFLPHI